MNTGILWIDILWPILSIGIPVFATLYTVNNRIKNENKENHKPYVILRKIEPLSKLDIYSYYLTLIGKNYNDNITTDNLDKDICVSLILGNIGYGVASNIRFYDLLTAKQIQGHQTPTKELNQKLFTTFDIASNDEKEIQARIINTNFNEEGANIEDHNRILCVYQDLNKNIYSLIISINVKVKGHYDFFAYQPSSKSYRKWIRENKKQYKKIIKEYGDL